MNNLDIAMQLLVSFAGFGCVMLAVYAALNRFGPYWRSVHKQLSQLSQDESIASVTVPSTPRRFVIDLASGGFPFRPQTGTTVRLKEKLLMAGIHCPSASTGLVAARVMLVLFPLTALVAAISTRLTDLERGFPVALVVSVVGWLAPGVWLNRRIHRYRLVLQASLPDFLDIVIVCLDAGLSLQESIRRVTFELRQTHPALAFELGIVQRDMELGSSVDQALRRFANRTQYNAVRTLSALVRESQRFGTQVTEALRGHGEMLRFEREQAAEENAQKASVKIILPMMLCIFPGIFVVLVAPAAIQIQAIFSRN